jgi:phage shock protein A
MQQQLDDQQELLAHLIKLNISNSDQIKKLTRSLQRCIVAIEAIVATDPNLATPIANSILEFEQQTGGGMTAPQKQDNHSETLETSKRHLSVVK